MTEIEGVTREMYRKIKPRSPNGVTEYQRWIDVYLILFPDTKNEAIPSPCRLESLHPRLRADWYQIQESIGLMFPQEIDGAVHITVLSSTIPNY